MLLLSSGGEEVEEGEEELKFSGNELTVEIFC